MIEFSVEAVLVHKADQLKAIFGDGKKSSGGHAKAGSLPGATVDLDDWLDRQGLG